MILPGPSFRVLGFLCAAAMAFVRPRADPSQLPTFERVLLLESTSTTSANVSVGDVNGDGHLDIVIAKGRHWPLVDRVLIGDGRGHFPSAYDLGPRADRTYSANLVDLDADGDLDVVISNDRPDPKRIYLNDGKGHFTEAGTYGNAEWETRNAAVVDLDGDGLPDIVVANRTSPERAANYVCLNRGAGRFEAACVAFSKEPATTITPSDFNHDGKMDLVVPYRDGGQSHVYVNVRAGKDLRFRSVPFGPPDATIRVSAVADLDRDGLADIVAIDERTGVFLFYGRQGESFSAGEHLGKPGRTPYALAVGDLNLDGAPDIIVGHVEAPSTVFFNDGRGRTFEAVDFGDAKGTAYGFAIGDLDSDGCPDIAMARSDAPNALYFGSCNRGATGRSGPARTSSFPAYERAGSPVSGIGGGSNRPFIR
jgi:hypothetical protein